MYINEKKSTRSKNTKRYLSINVTIDICLNHGASDMARLKSLLPKTSSTIVEANATVNIIV